MPLMFSGIGLARDDTRGKKSELVDDRHPILKDELVPITMGE